MNEVIITKELIISIHDDQIARFGGSYGVRDVGLFESCCLSPYQTFAGFELFPSIFDKAARFIIGFAKNQCFIDGNKRTAATTALVLLDLNGYELTLSNDELASFILSVANNEIPDEFISIYLENNSSAK